ncbi:MAG: 4Fe-4S binding protein [Phycisphaerales bacterium]|nr:4Fe-4S binding protein [Phycisphaerales bacterium]
MFGRRASSGGRIGLPVLTPRRPGLARPEARRSRIARWRMAALIVVHLLMIGHVLHWWWTGSSVGRFVLSDSMKTLELGEINPGFLLFAAALLATALLGRFMCGWICHMGAMQDLCAWILRKLHLRPHLFRSRLLGYVPLALALYMFVWPTLKREAVAPLLENWWPGISATLGVQPFPGFSPDLTTDAMWDGLPSLVLAIPFILVCAFATVYFLGARGLCRYGCPYGGFLLPAEQASIGRVAVDPDACDQCGLCTSTCTAGVRVHDEVRQYGSVLDRNCVRSLDCISVCPKKALTFTFAKPAMLARPSSGASPARVYDLTWGEEFLAIGVFSAVFFVMRGLYESIPLLMAAPMGVLAAYLAWKALRLAREPNVRISTFVLRRQGSITRAGRVFLACVALVTLAWAHAAVVRGAIVVGGLYDERVTTPYAQAIARQGISDETRADAARALWWYALAAPIGEGGIALAPTPSLGIRVPWLDLVLGRHDAAVERLQSDLAAGRAGDSTAVQLFQLLGAMGRALEGATILEHHLQDHPRWAESRDALATYFATNGRAGEAEALYRAALATRDTDVKARAGLGRLLLGIGRIDEGERELALASAQAPREAGIRRDHAIAIFMGGRVDEAVAELKAAAKARPVRRADLDHLAGQMLRQVGRVREAEAIEAKAGD